MRVRCEICPLQEICLCQTMATCPLVKLIEKEKEKEFEKNAEKKNR